MLYRNHSTSIRHQRSRLFFMRPLMLMSVIDNIRLTQSKRTCLIFSPSRSFSLSSSTLDHPAVLYISTLWLSIIISSQYRRCNEYCEHGPACIFPPTGITTSAPSYNAVTAIHRRKGFRFATTEKAHGRRDQIRTGELRQPK